MRLIVPYLIFGNMILNFQLDYRPINIYWVFIDFFLFKKNVNSSKIFWNILGKNKTKNINLLLSLYFSVGIKFHSNSTTIFYSASNFSVGF